MKKICLSTRRLLVIIAVLIMLSVASANAYDDSRTFGHPYSKQEYGTIEAGSGAITIEAIHFGHIENFTPLKHVCLVCPGAYINTASISGYPDDGITAVTGKLSTGEEVFTGRIGYNINRNKDESINNVVIWVDGISDFNPHGRTGKESVKLIWNSEKVPKFKIRIAKIYASYNPVLEANTGAFRTNWVRFGKHISGAENEGIAGRYIYLLEDTWLNVVNLHYDSVGYQIDLQRMGFWSAVDVTEVATNISYYRSNGNDDVHIQIPRGSLIDPPIIISVTASDGTPFSWNVDPDPGDDPGGGPDDPNVIVYVKNSQTGALIANANVVIDALVDGEYYTVANRTEPSGIFSITLQPTGGGQPNPDGYRLIVTADGYNNPMPEINFTVDDYKQSIYCLLDPIAGGPVNENKTFIDFFVRDMSSNPISGATVKFGKYTLITNSAGYTVFEVDKNNNYVWTVSKSGYGPLTGNAVIGNDPRHTINTVLAPIVTPTTTTPIPTSPPIGPTPTMTAPTGEHVSNLLEWLAAHFGMILGGGVEIGKIFMWLCFTVPVGVYVGKEARAGAAGFMAGAGIVTLFFVLIGWVPIWLLVLLALIIGLLYAKVFNSQDNGGGR